jgi:hypothetical protein
MKSTNVRKRAEPSNLYPLKFEEVVKDVLTMKPPPKERKRAKRVGTRRSKT